MSRRSKYEAEVVVFNGIAFRRYPDSPRQSDSRYYRPSPEHIRNGVECLHREVWKYHHGPIPDGHHVHHVDENTGNNDISNLECLPGFDHLSRHARKEEHRARARGMANTYRHLTKAWHASPEGIEWHRQNAIKCGLGHEKAEKVCAYCGKVYVGQPRANAQYCGNNCKSAARRKSGVDNIERTCPVCGAVYLTDKYRPSKSCGRACAYKSRDSPD